MFLQVAEEVPRSVYLFPTPFCPARPYALQTAHTYSSELLAAVTLLTRPTFGIPSRPPGRQASRPIIPWSSAGSQKQDTARFQPVRGYFGTGRILGGCWQGQSRKGRRWVFCPRLCVPSPLDATQGPRLPQGRAHPPQTPTSAQRVSEANRGRPGLGAPISVATVGGRVFICCDFSLRQDPASSKWARHQKPTLEGR